MGSKEERLLYEYKYNISYLDTFIVKLSPTNFIQDEQCYLYIKYQLQTFLIPIIERERLKSMQWLW